MSPSATLAPGAVFGRDFKIKTPLRAGGMGAVYVVEQLSTGKERALKIMSAELAADPTTRERFVLEARAASKIESDHVVEIVIAGVDEATGAPYLVMELLKGEELSDALRRTGALPIGDVAEVLSQVGHALEQAHHNGIVHRDLKPENIFLAASKRREVPFTAKVLDFGIAKLVEDSQKTGTQPLGTPLFMSPEQTDRRGRITPATDVWALGLMTYLMLTGRDYWREADGSLPQLLREICVDPLEPASLRAAERGLAERLPPGFDEWFARCVTRDIDQRFPDAGACVRAFVQGVAPPGVQASVLSVSSAVGAFGTGSITGPGASGALQAQGVSVASGSMHESGPNDATVALAPTGAGVGMTAPQPDPGSGKGTSKLVYAFGAALVLGGGAAFFAFRGGGAGAGEAPGGVATTTSSALAASASAPSASSAVAPSGPCLDGMILHPAGKMVMGAKDASADAAITHKVELSSFCLDKTEVTVGDYDACVTAGECEKPPKDVRWANMTDAQKSSYGDLCNARGQDRKQHPVNCVDWDMASAFCKWRGGRLPTEAEFEFAARGPQQRDYPWGDAAPDEKKLNACGAECLTWTKSQNMCASNPALPCAPTMYEADDGFASTAPVGSFADGASALGVLDLAGNVWEWTADWYAPYTADEQTDPKGPPEGEKRVVRGGGFNSGDAAWVRPAWRWSADPSTYNHGIGFRCASDPKAPGTEKASE